MIMILPNGTAQEIKDDSALNAMQKFIDNRIATKQLASNVELNKANAINIGAQAQRTQLMNSEIGSSKKLSLLEEYASKLNTDNTLTPEQKKSQLSIYAWQIGIPYTESNALNFLGK